MVAEAPGTVVVDDLWESFKIYTERAGGIRDRLFTRRKDISEEFWALRGVNLRIEPGETVGLIGENGSGKSTLLKCVAGIYEATRGHVSVHGRTASMLELGSGFHGDLTGRENVYLNGSILGFSRSYVDEVIDEIVGFAGRQVAEAFDRPVRTYSSGMYLRLGFAVSVHLEPDVLIIDEVLAVGDARFVKKCYDRIHELKRNGVTIVVVSHDLESIASLCDRAVYLERGEIVQDGPAVEVVDHYRSDITSDTPGTVGSWEGGAVYGTGAVELRDIRIVQSGEGAIATGDSLSVRFEAFATEDVQSPVFGLIVRSNDGTYLYDTNTLWRRQATPDLRAGQQVTVVFEAKVNLLPARYLVTVAASRSDGKQIYDWHTDAVAFDVAGEFVANGIVDLDASISLTKPEGDAATSARPTQRTPQPPPAR